MPIKSVTVLSALVLTAGLSATACGSGGASTASVCTKIKADGQRESSALSGATGSAGLNSKVANALRDFAGRLRNDVNDASSSGLKTAGDKFADDLDQLASDAEKKDTQALSSDAGKFRADSQKIEKYCPQLNSSGNSSNSSSGSSSTGLNSTSSSTSGSTSTSSGGGNSSSGGNSTSSSTSSSH